ncbi:hypothetical protein H8K35_01395 [Undibacterium sp. LX40W]|uniref:Uncharacterized protein n=1 Tax=Undibacterium nitidum TaxID=2762298 RepID=A0A923KSX4_9BURK|nr:MULTISPECIES: hypothetical protein [Undibacterium]MBC3880964.1 hypothetical protein [Undibacterium nitidum]MBC3890303.1 hypothetical protein [Undibacterium sp. LX40W]
MKVPTCRCCTPVPSPSAALVEPANVNLVSHRRRHIFLAPVAVFLSGAWGMAKAGDDLLSPFAKPKTKDGKPNAPSVSNAAAMAASESRAMAERSVSALAGLCANTNALIEQLAKLRAEIAEQQRKRQELEAFKAAEMEDYRNGLFCSGCNRTKRDILSKGETFPHSGQKIIAPTPEQIANKDAELQRPIDQLTAALAKNNKDAVVTDTIMRDGREQIEFGVWLWETSIGSERSAMQKNLQRKLDKLQAELKQIEKTIDDIRMAEFASKKNQEVASLEADRRMWQEVLQKRREAMEQEKLDYQRQMTKLERIYADEQTRIADFTARGALHLQINVVPSTRGRGSMLDPFNLGVHFRLGRMLSRSDVAGQVHPEIVASVDQFIQNYKRAAF